MKKKLISLINKAEAINSILRSNEWIVCFKDKKTKSVSVVHTDLGPDTLRKSLSYLNLKIQTEIDQQEANVNDAFIIANSQG